MKIHLSPLISIVLLFVLTVSAVAKEPDSQVVGQWISSNGSQITIDYGPGDSTWYVVVSIDGAASVGASLEPDRHNSIRVSFALPDGTPISGHYFGGEDLFRLTDQGQMWATWERAK